MREEMSGVERRSREERRRRSREEMRGEGELDEMSYSRGERGEVEESLEGNGE